jgi:hypothetical protein
MKEKVYVDRLFAGYEDTPEIRDFKEEIVGNLKERVKELISKGLEEEKAFDKAAAELGDITAIADDVGKKKRNEAIGQMYMNAKVPLTKKSAGGFSIATGLLLLGIGLALFSFFGNAGTATFYYFSVVLASAAIGLYVYFGLSRESAAHYPMKNSRASVYGIVCAFACLGAGLAVVSFMFDGFGITTALGIKMLLLLPSICALIFLLATESNRQKPWLTALVKHDMEKYIKYHTDMVNPIKAARFGVISGGLWILAIGLFLTLYLVVGWIFAWLVFVFALAVQVIMVATIFEKKK